MTNEINIYQGDDKQINVTIKDSNGDVIDISGYDFFFTVKEEYDDSDDDAVIKIDQSISDGSNGIVTIDIPKSETEDLETKRYVYDIQWKDGSGNIRTILVGYFNVKNEVTDRTTKET